MRDSILKFFRTNLQSLTLIVFLVSLSFSHPVIGDDSDLGPYFETTTPSTNVVRPGDTANSEVNQENERNDSGYFKGVVGEVVGVLWRNEDGSLRFIYRDELDRRVPAEPLVDRAARDTARDAQAHRDGRNHSAGDNDRRGRFDREFEDQMGAPVRDREAPATEVSARRLLEAYIRGLRPTASQAQTP